MARRSPPSPGARLDYGRARRAEVRRRQTASSKELDEDRLERVAELIQRLKAEASEGAVLVVEGRRDSEALRALGVQGTILHAKSSSSRLVDFAERIEGGTKVVVLTDFDRAGERLARFLRGALQRRRTKVDLAYRKRLSALLGGEVKDIQGLAERLGKVAAEEGERASAECSSA